MPFYPGRRPLPFRFQPRETFGEAFARGAGAGLGSSLTRLPFEVGAERIKEEFPGAVERRKALAAQRALDENTLLEAPERFEMEKGRFGLDKEEAAARVRGAILDNPSRIEVPEYGQHPAEIGDALAEADRALAGPRASATPPPPSVAPGRERIGTKFAPPGSAARWGQPPEWEREEFLVTPPAMPKPPAGRDEAAQDKDRALADWYRRRAAGGGRGGGGGAADRPWGPNAPSQIAEASGGYDTPATRAAFGALEEGGGAKAYGRHVKAQRSFADAMTLPPEVQAAGEAQGATKRWFAGAPDAPPAAALAPMTTSQKRGAADQAAAARMAQQQQQHEDRMVAAAAKMASQEEKEAVNLNVTMAREIRAAAGPLGMSAQQKAQYEAYMNDAAAIARMRGQ